MEIEIGRKTLIAIIWSGSAIASCFTKDDGPAACALIFTVLYGIWVGLNN